MLLIGPLGVGKSQFAQSLGQEAIRRGRKVYHRSIFDLVRDLRFTANGSSQQNTMLNRYLKPELLIIDDMGSRTERSLSWRSSCGATDCAPH